MAMLAITAMVFAGCGKDDEEDEKSDSQNEVTVSFDANGGSGTMESVKLASGEKLPKCTFLPGENLKFAGWVTSQGDTIATITDTATVKFTQDTKLYAIWYWKYDLDHFLTKKIFNSSRSLMDSYEYDPELRREYYVSYLNGSDKVMYRYTDYVIGSNGRIDESTEYWANPYTGLVSDFSDLSHFLVTNHSLYSYQSDNILDIHSDRTIYNNLTSAIWETDECNTKIVCFDPFYCYPKSITFVYDGEELNVKLYKRDRFMRVTDYFVDYGSSTHEWKDIKYEGNKISYTLVSSFSGSQIEEYYEYTCY